MSSHLSCHNSRFIDIVKFNKTKSKKKNFKYSKHLFPHPKKQKIVKKIFSVKQSTKETDTQEKKRKRKILKMSKGKNFLTPFFRIFFNFFQRSAGTPSCFYHSFKYTFFPWSFFVFIYFWSIPNCHKNDFVP